MKFCKRYCYLFLCCLLLSVAFSTTANAVDDTISNTKVQIDVGYQRNIGSGGAYGTITIYPYNEIKESSGLTSIQFSGTANEEIDFYTRYIVSDADNNFLLKGGKTYTVSANSFYHNIGMSIINKADGSTVNTKYFDAIEGRALITYIDNTAMYVELSELINNGRNINTKITFEAEKDVKSIEYLLYTEAEKINNTSYTYKFWSWLGEFEGDSSFLTTYTASSEESGLLSGLLGVVNGIKNSMSNVTSGITNAISKIGEVVNGITELPNKLWSLISEGLRNLFVPTEEQLTKFKTDMDSLLESKLGALYEVGDLLINSLRDCFNSVENADPLESIAIPEVSIPLPGGESFSFGGYDVKIIPEGFEWIVDAVKAITGVVFTLYFVNGLRKRYDEIMGGK